MISEDVFVTETELFFEKQCPIAVEGIFKEKLQTAKMGLKSAARHLFLEQEKSRVMFDLGFAELFG